MIADAGHANMQLHDHLLLYLRATENCGESVLVKHSVFGVLHYGFCVFVFHKVFNVRRGQQ